VVEPVEGQLHLNRCTAWSTACSIALASGGLKTKPVPHSGVPEPNKHVPSTLESSEKAAHYIPVSIAVQPDGGALRCNLDTCCACAVSCTKPPTLCVMGCAPALSGWNWAIVSRRPPVACAIGTVPYAMANNCRPGTQQALGRHPSGRLVDTDQAAASAFIST
jgi:hypothetical protein